VCILLLAIFGRPAVEARADDGDDPALLALSVTTDTLPGEAPLEFLAVAGEPVQRLYTVTNESPWWLENVTVADPQAPGLAHCGRGGATPVTLAPLASVTCAATFPAVAGRHRATVTATATTDGEQLTWQPTLVGEAETGYAATEASLRVRETLTADGQQVGTTRAGQPIAITVTLLNDGMETLRDLVLTDVLTAAAPDCGGARGPTIPALAPGASSTCSTTSTALPGAHSGQDTVTGFWYLRRPISPSGPEPPRTVEFSASGNRVGYVGVRPPAPTTSPPRPPAPRRSAAPVVVRAGTQPHTPPSRPPAPPPPIQPSPPPAAENGPPVAAGGPPQQRKGLGLMLTALVVVIAPAIMAVRRFRHR
jgi:hypothetical protein